MTCLDWIALNNYCGTIIYRLIVLVGKSIGLHEMFGACSYQWKSSDLDIDLWLLW